MRKEGKDGEGRKQGRRARGPRQKVSFKVGEHENMRQS